MMEDTAPMTGPSHSQSLDLSSPSFAGPSGVPVLALDEEELEIEGEDGLFVHSTSAQHFSGRHWKSLPVEHCFVHLDASAQLVPQ